MAIAILQQVVGVSATYLGENVAWTATNALRAEMARHCLNLDMSYHNNVSPGELIERIDGDVAELSNFFSQLVIRVLGNMLLLFGILIALLLRRLAHRAGLHASSPCSPCWRSTRCAASPSPTRRNSARPSPTCSATWKSAWPAPKISAPAARWILCCSGIYKLSVRVLGFWRAAQRRFMVVRFTAGMLMTVGRGDGLCRRVSTSSTPGMITLGTVYLIVTYTNLLRRPIRELTQQVENLQNIGAATERLRELRAIQTKITDGPGAELPAGALGLAFEDVHFAYKEGEPVLEQIDFQLKPGTVLGLLGRTGSGKTTLARLVFRLYDPTHGRIASGRRAAHPTPA